MKHPVVLALLLGALLLAAPARAGGLRGRLCAS
jgi:hypothetical protein